MFRALDDDGFAACFYVAGADEHAKFAEVLIAHAVGVAFEVAELFVQVFGFDAGEGVGAGGLDDRLDVAGVEFGTAVC